MFVARGSSKGVIIAGRLITTSPALNAFDARFVDGASRAASP